MNLFIFFYQWWLQHNWEILPRSRHQLIGGCHARLCILWIWCLSHLLLILVASYHTPCWSGLSEKRLQKKSPKHDTIFDVKNIMNINHAGRLNLYDKYFFHLMLTIHTMEPWGLMFCCWYIVGCTSPAPCAESLGGTWDCLFRSWGYPVLCPWACGGGILNGCKIGKSCSTDSKINNSRKILLVIVSSALPV